MIQPDEFSRRRPDIRVRDGENLFVIRQPWPQTAFEREQFRKLLAIPAHFPVVAAVGVGSIEVEGHSSSPRAITLMEESAIFLNRLSIRRTQSPWLWAIGSALSHEIAHLQGFMEHGEELDAAAYAIWTKIAEVMDP